MATLDLVERSIDESKAQDSIVHVDSLDIRRAGLDVDTVCDALFAECDGDVLNDGEHEYWGKDCEGNPWRVHVRVS